MPYEYGPKYPKTKLGMVCTEFHNGTVLPMAPLGEFPNSGFRICGVRGSFPASVRVFKGKSSRAVFGGLRGNISAF